MAERRMPPRAWLAHPSFPDYLEDVAAHGSAMGPYAGSVAPESPPRAWAWGAHSEKSKSAHTVAPGLLRIMSYNILAPVYAKSGFEYCPAKFLAPEHRWKLVNAELKQYRPAVACLQEVETRVFAHTLKPFMQELGYSFASFSKFADDGERVGVATFVRDDAADVLGKLTLRIRDLALHDTVGAPLQGARKLASRKPAVSSDNDATPTHELGDADAVAAWPATAERAHQDMWEWLSEMHHVAGVTILAVTPSLLPASATAAAPEPLDATDYAEGASVIAPTAVPRLLAALEAGKRLVVVGNFHAYWNPRWPEIKAVQTALVVRGMADVHRRIMLQLAELGLAHTAVGMMLCGDFNSMPAIVGPTRDYNIVPDGETLVPGVHTLMLSSTLAREHPHHPFTRGCGEAGGTPLLVPELAPPIDIPYRFSSAYESASGAEPAWTNWHWHSFKETLDFIYFAREVKPSPVALLPAPADVVRLVPLVCLDVPSSAAVRALEGGDAGGCPNAGVPSDHIPIVADFFVPAAAVAHADGVAADAVS